MEEAATTECEPYERRWRDRAVDRNLKNVWLERLNGLETLELVSICEGHLDARPNSIRRHPSIVLGFRKEYVKTLTEHGYGVKKELTDSMENIWPADDTAIELEVQHQLNRDIGDWENRDEIILRVFSKRTRTTDHFPAWANVWFRQSVFRVETFGRFLKNFVITKGERR